jgi:hypothetical protein
MAVEAAITALDQIAKAIEARECILFLGAGAHAGPPPEWAAHYPPEQRPPIGSQLSQALARQLRLEERFPHEDPANLQRVSLFYEIEQGRGALIDAVTREVAEGTEPSPMLGALARLDFPVVITTNYDRLFERALYAAGKEPRVSIYDPEDVPTVDYPRPTAESPVVWKIHGDVSRRESVVITDEDYIQFVLRMSSKEPYDPFPRRLKVQLVDWTTVFVGYSLLDYNLRLLFKTLRWQIDRSAFPAMYSVDFKPDPLILDVYEKQRRYLKFIAQNVWSFVPALSLRVTGKELEP